MAAPDSLREGPHRPLGLQLFTVWDALERDFQGTLKAVAAMGYKKVETMGAFGRDPQRVRDMLDRAGLVAASQHVMPCDLYPLSKAFEAGRIPVTEVLKRLTDSMPVDRMSIIVEEAISRARVLGQKHVVWHVTPDEAMSSSEVLDHYCRALNAAGRLCASEGMVFGIHNHNTEFKRTNGVVPYDVMVENTDPATVKFEMDVCWVVSGHADPVSYLTKYPNRFRQLHLKDCSAKGEVALPGHGIVDFVAVIKASRASIENYYVEYDHATDPLAVARQCYEYFSKRI